MISFSIVSILWYIIMQIIALIIVHLIFAIIYTINS